MLSPLEVLRHHVVLPACVLLSLVGILAPATAYEDFTTWTEYDSDEYIGVLYVDADESVYGTYGCDLFDSAYLYKSLQTSITGDFVHTFVFAPVHPTPKDDVCGIWGLDNSAPASGDFVPELSLRIKAGGTPEGCSLILRCDSLNAEDEKSISLVDRQYCLWDVTICRDGDTLTASWDGEEQLSIDCSTGSFSHVWVTYVEHGAPDEVTKFGVQDLSLN